jgi:glycosyltransferase involved in cell wall biosynthesis
MPTLATLRDLSLNPLTSGSQALIEVSVVLPCLNEADTVGACVKKATASLLQCGVNGEVIVADNGSTDGSEEIATALGARVVNVTTRGYGAALAAGIEAARGEFVIMADADDSYDLENLAPFIDKLRGGCDLVMGNRFAGGIQPGAMPPLHRYLGNPVLTSIGRRFFRTPARDFHCGMRGFKRTSAISMDLRTTGMEFASEMVVKASLLNMIVAEVPTRLFPDGRSHPPHLRSWRDGWRHLRFLLLYSPRFLFFVPGVALAVVGLLGGTLLAFGPRHVGNVTFDVNSLLFCAAAVILGFQAILFATFAKVFAISEGLLPMDPRLDRLFRIITLETGLVVGASMFSAGLLAAFAAVEGWRTASFGPLDPEHTLRLVIPSVSLMVLGAEVIMGSFFLSILGLRRK